MAEAENVSEKFLLRERITLELFVIFLHIQQFLHSYVNISGFAWIEDDLVGWSERSVNDVHLDLLLHEFLVSTQQCFAL